MHLSACGLDLPAGGAQAAAFRDGCGRVSAVVGIADDMRRGGFLHIDPQLFCACVADGVGQRFRADGGNELALLCVFRQMSVHMHLHADGLGGISQTGQGISFLLGFGFQPQHVDVALPDVDDLLCVAGFVLQIVAGHQQRLPQEAVEVHTGLQPFTGDDVLINLVAVAADTGVHLFQFAVLGAKLIHQLMLMGGIRSSDLKGAVYIFPVE